jgi:hypothetical protein
MIVSAISPLALSFLLGACGDEESRAEPSRAEQVMPPNG